MGEGGLRLGCVKVEGQGFVVDIDQVFMLCSVFVYELVDGQGIEEFIGDKECWLFGQSVDGVMLNCVGDQFFLFGVQSR